eukprot:scaffold1687_cov405-Prasinococcus_capsulatus_cf.AAC.2
MESAAPGTLTVVDCGAGVGRITEQMLIHMFDIVDLAEPVTHFLDKVEVASSGGAKLVPSTLTYALGYPSGEGKLAGERTAFVQGEGKKVFLRAVANLHASSRLAFDRHSCMLLNRPPDGCGLCRLLQEMCGAAFSLVCGLLDGLICLVMRMKTMSTAFSGGHQDWGIHLREGKCCREWLHRRPRR